jgi:hypothetical protein
MKKRQDADKKHNLEYMASCFMNDQADETKCIMVGQEREFGGSLRVVNEVENIETD